jgi:hypothetical protein
MINSFYETSPENKLFFLLIGAAAADSTFGAETLSKNIFSISYKVIDSSSFTLFQTGTLPSQALSIPFKSDVTTKLVPLVLSRTTLFHIIYFNLKVVFNSGLFNGISFIAGGGTIIGIAPGIGSIIPPGTGRPGGIGGPPNGKGGPGGPGGIGGAPKGRGGPGGPGGLGGAAKPGGIGGAGGPVGIGGSPNGYGIGGPGGIGGAEPGGIGGAPNGKGGPGGPGGIGGAPGGKRAEPGGIGGPPNCKGGIGGALFGSGGGIGPAAIFGSGGIGPELFGGAGINALFGGAGIEKLTGGIGI